MFYKNFKKYGVIILLTTIIFIISLQFINQKAEAQGQSGYGYPAIIEGIQPWVRFWVSTDSGTGASTTLSVKDDSTVAVRNGTTTEYYTSVELLGEIFQEMKRNNLWYQQVVGNNQKKITDTTQLGSRTLLEELTSTTTEWMKSGFNNASSSGQGNPAYVSDSANMLAKKDNLLIKNILMNNPAMNSLDDSINLQVRRSILSDNGNDSYLPNQLNCTAEQIDTEKPLDWNNWLSLSLQPQCTETGAKDIIEKYIQNAEAVQAENFSQELSYGKGALTYKECKVYEIDATGKKTLKRTYMGDSVYDSEAEDTYEIIPGPLKTFTQTECKVMTPGSVTSDQLSFIDSSQNDIAKLSSALGSSENAVLIKIKEKILGTNSEKLQKGILGDTSNSAKEYQEMIEKELSTTTSENFMNESPLNTQNTYSYYNPAQPQWGLDYSTAWYTGDDYDPCITDPDFCIFGF